jgi:hypothetical protein
MDGFASPLLRAAFQDPQHDFPYLTVYWGIIVKIPLDRLDLSSTILSAR